MAIWVDRMYINRLAIRLDRFKWKDDKVAICRCPLCGDSQKNKSKMRGYFLIGEKGYYYFMCHNCHASMSLSNLLKELDYSLYKEYAMENFKQGTNKKQIKPDISKFKKPVFKKEEPEPESLLEKMMPRCDKLPRDNIAVKYLISRKIPKNTWKLFYYLDDFTQVENISKSYKDKLRKEPRLIIPFYDRRGKLTAIQGRALDDNPMRYVTLKIDEDAPLVFGMDRLDMSKPIYVVEGPIDSVFIPNCLAIAGSDMKKVAHLFKKSQVILIPDKQPRNKEILKLIESFRKQGFQVCLLPDWMHGKDINEFVNNGMSPKRIFSIINEHTYQGLKLAIAFTEWKKIT